MERIDLNVSYLFISDHFDVYRSLTSLKQQKLDLLELMKKIYGFIFMFISTIGVHIVRSAFHIYCHPFA